MAEAPRKSLEADYLEPESSGRKRPTISGEPRRASLIHESNPEQERIRRGERAKLLREKNRVRSRK